jgi:uncharacterized protein YaaW (UPF0174 family)
MPVDDFTNQHSAQVIKLNRKLSQTTIPSNYLLKFLNSPIKTLQPGSLQEQVSELCKHWMQLINNELIVCKTFVS